MADVSNPITTENTVGEPIAAPLPLAVEETKPVVTEASKTKAEEPAKDAEVAAPVEEKKEEKPIEPIYSGSLGYKAPGLFKNPFSYSKKYFWFGEDAVETKHLSEYLRGEKPDVAHPTAAWSSQTGKGLLYFVKHADKKETPAGVLRLAGASELAKDGFVAFHFKIDGHKHSFEASTTAERNGWFVAFEKAIEEAKAKETEIVESESYKEQLEKLKKPAPFVAAASSSAPKKSTDLDTAKPAEPTEATPARAGSSSSSSSSSSDEDKKKKKKSKSKSRSVSRGKRASFFGGLLNKKDKVEEKAEEKKEEKAEEKKDEPATTTEAEASAPVITPVVAPATEEAPKAAEEPKLEEAVATDVATEPKVEKTEEKKPKPTKRGSIFGTLREKLKSPTTEKKESDVVPAVPAKDTETPAEAPKAEPIIAPTEIIAEQAEAAAKAEEKETKPAGTTPTPHKEKEHFSFGKFLNKAKSPTTETAPKLEEPTKKEATPEPAAPAVPAVEDPKEEDKKEETPIGVTTTASAAPAPKKRGSVFGSLFRKASTSIRPKKEESSATPAKAEESVEAKEEDKKVDEAPTEETAEKKPTEPVTIGDVVPEAVQVGQAPKSTPEVSATA
jgi:hypothetical protein